METFNLHLVSREDAKLDSSPAAEVSLEKRRGGGGGRGGGGFSGGGAKSGGSSSSGSRGSSSGRAADGSSTSRNSMGFTPGSVSGGAEVRGSRFATGMAQPFTVSQGAFAGRQAGGATRGTIYGSPQYGSGYPSGYTARNSYVGGGVAGRGFPFIFWPIYYPGGAYYGSREYNMSGRPGGEMTQYTLQPWSNITNASANQFALYADLNSVDSVFQTLQTDCDVPSNLAPNFTVNFNQAVEYYRASSFALLLNGYNNTQPAIEGTDNATTSNVTAPPLPSGVNMDYVNCINMTIGQAVPLIDSVENSSMRMAATQPSFLALVSLIVMFITHVLT